MHCLQRTQATYLAHWHIVLLSMELKLNLNWCDNGIDDHTKDGGPGEVSILCSSSHEPLRT